MPLADYLAFLPFRRSLDPGRLPVEGRLPEFNGLTGWLNSPPLTRANLAGKVVLVDFWTLSCINCQRTLPYLNAWHQAYASAGLVIIGVHTPEFPFEKEADNVRAAVAAADIRYPIATDNDFALWNTYGNHYWPSHYFADAEGNLRHHQYGEGGYGQGEAVIRALLAEAGHQVEFPPVSDRMPSDTDFRRVRSPETYFGFDRMEYLGSPESVRPGAARRFSGVGKPAKNVFYFEGLWEVDDEFASPAEPGAAVTMRFDAARVFLVAEGTADGQAFEVTVDGQAPQPGHLGKDVTLDAAGMATLTVREGRMYRLYDAVGDYGERTLKLTSRNPGARLYAMTFG